MEESFHQASRILSTLTNAVLQAIGQVNKPVVNAAIALVIQTVVLVVLLMNTQLGLYSLGIVTIIYSLSMCLLNERSVRKELQYKQTYKKTFVLPLIASSIMGAVAYWGYQGMYHLIESNIISLVIAIILAVLTYAVLVIKLNIITRKELANIPKGHLFISIACKLKLMK